MKIAVITEDGVKLSSHFGTAPSYRVLTIEDGKIINDEMIDKPHNQTHKAHGKDHEHDHTHHGAMKFFDPIKDCQILLAGGMGEPPYKRAQSFGIEVIMTGGTIDAAIEAYINGDLHSDDRRVHRH